MRDTGSTRKGRHIDPTNHAPEFVSFVPGSVKEDGEWLEFEDSRGVRLSLLLLPSVERHLANILVERGVLE